MSLLIKVTIVTVVRRKDSSAELHNDWIHFVIGRFGNVALNEKSNIVLLYITNSSSV